MQGAAWWHGCSGQNGIRRIVDALFLAILMKVALIRSTRGQSRQTSSMLYSNSSSLCIALRRYDGGSQSGRNLKTSTVSFITPKTEHRSSFRICKSPRGNRRDNLSANWLTADIIHSALIRIPNRSRTSFSCRSSRIIGRLAETKLWQCIRLYGCRYARASFEYPACISRFRSARRASAESS